MKRKHTEESIDSQTTSTPVNQKNLSSISPRILDFEEDSDDEIVFNTLPNKRLKMSKTDELKIWIQGQFAEQLTKVATREQVEKIAATTDANSKQIASNSTAIQKNQKDIADLQGSIRSMEMKMGTTKSKDNTLPNQYFNPIPPARYEAES